MPANLNALIRYKTIDSCLSNPYRKWTIGDLKDACSSALKEHRGIYSGISERSIREDIRVIRSDILRFNVGEDAGQTIDHIHIIPRYHGDMDDPTGGVRHVIPEKGKY